MKHADPSAPKGVRLPKSSAAPVSPPAIWSAFARQAAWKSWVLLLQLAIIVLLVAAVIVVSRREPDIVLVAPDGNSTYLNRSLAGDALMRFLAEQRQQPSETTVVHFTKDFLQAFLAVNSSTIESAWPASLSMMTAGLRARISREASAQKLVETYKRMQVQTDLRIDELVMVSRYEKAIHIRATVFRLTKGLLDGEPRLRETLAVDLVEAVVSRSASHPDGLQVAEYRNKVVNMDQTVVTPSEPATNAAIDNAH